MAAYQHADEAEEEDAQVVVGLLQRVWMSGSSEEQCASHDGVQSHLPKAEDVNKSAEMTNGSQQSSQQQHPVRGLSNPSLPYVQVRLQLIEPVLSLQPMTDTTYANNLNQHLQRKLAEVRSKA